MDLIPYPDQVFEPPVITDIRSPAAGVVVFNLQPMVYSGKGNYPRIISVYKSDGTQLDYARFDSVANTFGALSGIDTSSLSKKIVNQMVVAGLKSGETSFFVKVKLEQGGWAKGIIGNILTVNVAGTATRNSSYAVDMNPLTIAGVDPGRWLQDTLLLYPNPADRSINVRVPADGEATVRIFNSLGDQVAGGSTTIAGGSGALDIAGLAVGRYVAVIEHGRHVYRAPFIVVR